jgi:hypothetical protein
VPKIMCELVCHSNEIPLQQLYTGFFLLQRRGIIDIKQKFVPAKIPNPPKAEHLRYARYCGLRVVVNKRLTLHYDTHDTWDIDEELLSACDFYFKRSFSSSYLKNLATHRHKVHPLGLVYQVYPNHWDRFAVRRSIFLDNYESGKLKALLRSLLPIAARKLSSMESWPDFDAPAKIIFMTRAWAPHEAPSQDKAEEFLHLSETRAKCIRMLRDEFGVDFYGGFMHSDFASKNYKDALLPDHSLSASRNYLNLLRNFPIGVATAGLHGSIGWKFAEYVALSKAILSEKLCCEVPGDLRKGVNYLEFSSPEDCVIKAKQLCSDHHLRNSLMINNARYYESYLRPDSLVLNSILIALAEQSADFPVCATRNAASSPGVVNLINS